MLRAEAADSLRKAGLWGGGTAMFPYEARKQDNHWVLLPCNGTCEFGINSTAEVWSMAKAVLAGMPVAQIVDELNARNVLTSRDAQRVHAGKAPTGTQWRISTVLQLLRSEHLLGYVLHYRKGETPKRVYDNDGNQVMREPILDLHTWQQVQIALNARSAPRNRTNPSRSSLIAGIGFCFYCGGSLRKSRNVRYNRSGEIVVRAEDSGYNYYYQCANMRDRSVCPDSLSIPMDVLNAAINDAMMTYADEPYLTVIETPGHSVKSQMDQLERDVRALDFFGDPKAQEKLTAMKTEYARLESVRSIPAESKIGTDGRTFGQVWAAMDTDERRRYLSKPRKNPIRVFAALKPGADYPLVGIEGGDYPDIVAGLGGVTAEQYVAWQWEEIAEMLRARGIDPEEIKREAAETVARRSA